MYPVLSHRVSKFSFEGFQLVLKIEAEQWLYPRVTKQNEQQVSFAKSDQQVNR